MSRIVFPRREFARFLAASPLMARAWAQDASATITSPKDALEFMDFEPLARKALPPAHWGYMATGVDGDVTLRANREAFEHYQLRGSQLTEIVPGKTDWILRTGRNTLFTPLLRTRIEFTGCTIDKGHLLKQNGFPIGTVRVARYGVRNPG